MRFRLGEPEEIGAGGAGATGDGSHDATACPLFGAVALVTSQTPTRCSRHW
jgi:hypothetical protein